jgi:hypothetical protein
MQSPTCALKCSFTIPSRLFVRYLQPATATATPLPTPKEKPIEQIKPTPITPIMIPIKAHPEPEIR